MSDFLSIANEITGGKQKPSGFASVANDFGVETSRAQPKQEAATFDDSKPPQFAIRDKEAFRKQIANNPRLLAEFDRQYPPQQLYQDGRAVIPGAPVETRPPEPEKKRTMWDRVVGADEALATAVTGIPAALWGAAVGLTSAAMGGDADKTAIQTAEKYTYTPKTEAGKGYAETVGKAGEQLMPMSGLGAEAAALTRSARPVNQAVLDTVRGSSMEDMRASFQGKKAPEAAAPTTAAPQATQAAKADPLAPSLERASPELQTAVKQASQKGPVNMEVVNRHVEADTLPVPMRMSEGQASLNPQIISNEMNGRGGVSATDAEFFNRQGKQLVQNAQVLRERAAPDIQTTNHVETGQLLVDRIKAVREPIVADIRAKYKALEEANGGQFPVDGATFVANAEAALSKKLKSAYLPAEVKSQLEAIKERGSMTFEEFEALRTNLAEDARTASNGNVRAAAGIVREALEQIPISGEAGPLKALADAARKAAREEFARQERDPAYKAVAGDSAAAGEASALADKFVENHVVKGKGANVKQLKANLGGDALANQAIAAAVIDYMTAKAGADMRTGTFSQSGWNSALKTSIEPKILDLMDPQSAQLVKQIGNVAKYTQVQPRGHFVNNSNTFTAAAANKAATAAEKVGNAVIPGADLGTEVRGFVANRQRKKAAEKSIAPGAGINRASDFPGVNE